MTTTTPKEVSVFLFREGTEYAPIYSAVLLFPKPVSRKSIVKIAEPVIGINRRSKLTTVADVRAYRVSDLRRKVRSVLKSIYRGSDWRVPTWARADFTPSRA